MVCTQEVVKAQSFIHQQKPLWNSCAILYTLLSYGGSLALLINANTILNGLGVLFLTHSLVYSAYLSHEFMHGNIFKHRHWNTYFGMIMLWLNGGCYFGFRTLTIQHIEHHVRRTDVLTFDIQTALAEQSPFIRQCILVLEWCYFPIVAFWSRWRAITLPWRHDQASNRKTSIILILVIRGVLFTLVGLISLKALLLYFIAYIGMITVLRFMDAFQHTYEGFSPGSNLPKYDFDYEQTHTFSNLLCFRYPFVNLLLLNFGYHNAHHAMVRCPWHSLSELDKVVSNNQLVRYIPLWQQIKNYHLFRMTRFLKGQGQVTSEPGALAYGAFYGATDVSFITLY